MYTVSKGPSKIVAKSRRGLTQNFEKFETIKESSRNVETSNSKNVGPRPVFQTVKKPLLLPEPEEQPELTPQHEEIVNYINDSWNVIVANNPYDATQHAANGIDQPAVVNKADTNNNVNSANTNGTGGDYVARETEDGAIAVHFVKPTITSRPTSPSAAAVLGAGGLPMPTGPAVYCIEPPSPELSNFQPFDLEAWWGRRLFNNITESI